MKCNGSTVEEVADIVTDACRQVDSMAALSEIDVRAISFNENRQVHLWCTEYDFYDLFGQGVKRRRNCDMDRISAKFAGCEFFTLVTPQPAIDRMASASAE